MLFFSLLILLQVKHWLFDFVLQTAQEIQWKGVYLDWRGMTHSFKHGLGTGLVMLVSGVPVTWVVGLALIDCVAHYHIDWLKMNYGNQNSATAEFWNHLGLDQMAHQLTYVAMIAILTFLSGFVVCQ